MTKTNEVQIFTVTDGDGVMFHKVILFDVYAYLTYPILHAVGKVAK